MKICLISRYATLKGAGIGRAASRIYEGLQARGHDVTMVHDGNSLAAYWFYTVVRKPFLLPRGCDVYHALSPVESLWLPEDKAVVSIHDLFPVLYESFQGAGVGTSKFRQRVAGEFFAHSLFKSSMCNRVVCNSTLTSTQYIQFVEGFRKQTDIIYWGIADDLRPVRHQVTRRPRIGYLGQLDRRKRVNVLIDSFKRSTINADLMIAGTGPDSEKLKILAGDDPRITFLGFLPDSKLQTFYTSLTALVLPSYMEGWGLPAVEAMACGVPVVILDDMVMPYEIRLKCHETMDLKMLFDAVDSGMPLERNAHVDWARSHTWDKCISQYEDVYRDIALNSCRA